MQVGRIVLFLLGFLLITNKVIGSDQLTIPALQDWDEMFQQEWGLDHDLDSRRDRYILVKTFILKSYKQYSLKGLEHPTWKAFYLHLKEWDRLVFELENSLNDKDLFEEHWQHLSQDLFGKWIQALGSFSEKKLSIEDDAAHFDTKNEGHQLDAGFSFLYNVIIKWFKLLALKTGDQELVDTLEQEFKNVVHSLWIQAPAVKDSYELAQLALLFKKYDWALAYLEEAKTYQHYDKAQVRWLKRIVHLYAYKSVYESLLQADLNLFNDFDYVKVDQKYNRLSHAYQKYVKIINFKKGDPLEMYWPHGIIIDTTVWEAQLVYLWAIKYIPTDQTKLRATNIPVEEFICSHSYGQTLEAVKNILGHKNDTNSSFFNEETNFSALPEYLQEIVNLKTFIKLEVKKNLLNYFVTFQKAHSFSTAQNMTVNQIIEFLNRY